LVKYYIPKRKGIVLDLEI